MSRKEIESEDVLYFILVFAQTIPLAMWRGFVMQRIWLWFVVPLFGLPPLSIPQSLGLILVASFLASGNMVTPKSGDDDEDMGTRIEKLFAYWLVPAFILLYGWILTHWL